MLSNILLYDFDVEISERVSKHRILYSRYADDLTFSAPRTGYLNEVEKIIRDVLRNSSSPKLKINENKTVLATRKVRRQVTGLIIDLDGNVSIGRDKKRLIRSCIHHFVIGDLEERNIAKLAGYLSHIWNVGRDFYFRIERAYGQDTLREIKRRGAKSCKGSS